MNIFTKAWLSIKRRPKKNLLLSLIISITLLLLFFISSIKFNLDSLEKSIEKTVPFGINIKNKNHENLNEKDIQKYTAGLFGHGPTFGMQQFRLRLRV